MREGKKETHLTKRSFADSNYDFFCIKRCKNNEGTVLTMSKKLENIKSK